MRRPEPMERRLTLHQLRIFKSVVDHQSFTRAAETLCLSQPGVTHQIQALTEAVGHPLFQGNHGRMDLTSVGVALYQRARQIMAMVNEAEDEIDGIIGLRTGSLRLAVGQTVAAWVLPATLAAFQRAHPDVRIKLALEIRDVVTEQLRRGQADLGVIRGPLEHEQLEGEPLVEDELLCLCAPGHRLARRQPLELADLAEGPLLAREAGSGTRIVLDALLAEHGLRAAPAMEVAGNEPLKRLVAGGYGTTALSRHAVRDELAQGRLVALEVQGFPIRRTWHLVWPRGRVVSPAADAFRELVRTPAWRAALDGRALAGRG